MADHVALIISSHWCCQSVPIGAANLCPLVLPFSAHQCCLLVSFSAAYQCPSL
ncbi:unnamed protein product, partial [Staurois parvus]